MSRILSLITILNLFVSLLACNFSPNKTNSVLPVHSHNDYENEYPLFDALACNFKSIEADIYSIGNPLFNAGVGLIDTDDLNGLKQFLAIIK